MTAAQVEARLTADESTRRTQLEERVDRGLPTFLETGEALYGLREEKLYRSTHGTFEVYAKERFGLGVRHSRRLIEAAKIVEAMGPIGPIENEAQARELVGLPDDTAREVYTAASEATDGKPTAKALREAREQIAPTNSRDAGSAPETAPGCGAPPVVAVGTQPRRRAGLAGPSRRARQARGSAASMTASSWPRRRLRRSTASTCRTSCSRKEEYAHLIADHYGAVKRESSRVRAYQEQCQAVHGVWLEVADCVERFS